MWSLSHFFPSPYLLTWFPLFFLFLLLYFTQKSNQKYKKNFIEGESLGKHFICPFFEISAKNKDAVDQVFTELVREIRKYNRVSCSYIVIVSSSAANNHNRDNTQV